MGILLLPQPQLHLKTKLFKGVEKLKVIYSHMVKEKTIYIFQIALKTSKNFCSVFGDFPISKMPHIIFFPPDIWRVPVYPPAITQTKNQTSFHAM
jgi:hypothetical protein